MKNLHYGLLSRGSAFGLMVLALCGAGAPGALAMVDANSPANTNAPPDGAPWANVGGVNGASAIYLGSGWVLTAYHDGSGNPIFGGVTYPLASSQRLTNSDGSGTDMLLLHLGASPSLPTLPLALASPAGLSPVDFIGMGKIAGSAQTNFGAYTGFYWSNNGFKSWGNNKVQSGGVQIINAGFGNVTAFPTDFTGPGVVGPGAQTSDECQAAAGDSGGGVFQLGGAGWQLAGMIDAIEAFPDQPANTSVYSDATLAVDIATYRNEILTIIRRTGLPSLTIARSGAGVSVCWPDTAAGFNLEATNLLSPTNWTTVVAGVASTNGQGCLLLPVTGPPQFFRLRLAQ